MIVNTNTPLSFTVPMKFFQSVSWRFRKFFNTAYIFDLPKFAEGDSFNCRKATAMETPSKQLCFLISKRANHLFSVARLTWNGIASYLQ